MSQQIENILNYIRENKIIESYSISDMADFFEVKPVLVHEIISRIEQVHRYKRIGKKVDHRSIKYLDFEASEKTDSDIFIKLKNKEI